MNETELLDSLHDARILAIKQDGRRVIIEINYVAEWEPQEEKGHYHLVYVPAGLMFKEAEVVIRTGDYARLDELPARHAARIILWVDAVDDASAGSGHHIQRIETKHSCMLRALGFDTAFGLLNRRALAYSWYFISNWYNGVLDRKKKLKYNWHTFSTGGERRCRLPYRRS